jgi:lambda family phage portal protein
MSRVTIRPAPQPQIRNTLYDKMVSFFSPTGGVKRLAARIQEANAIKLASSLGYTAGSSDKKSLQEWNPLASEPNEDFLYQAETIRGRSRDLTRNSPIAAGASNTATTNVVGTGMRLHSRIDANFLGITEEVSQQKQREMERIWRWIKDSLDFEGDVSMMDLQQMAFRGVFESGDVLVVRRRDSRPGDLIPLKVQLVEADRISNPNNTMDTTKITGGVEADARGVVRAYHVADRHPGQIFMDNAANTRWYRIVKTGRNGIPLSRLLFDKRRPGQRRGVPALAPVVEPLKQISRLTDYELTASVVSSLFTVFVKTETPQTGGLPSAPEGSEEIPSKTGDIFLNPGGVIDLLPGEDITTASPNRPNNAYDPFFRSIVQQIGMALEIPYEILMHVYGQSYSASRAALLDAWRFFRGRRTWLSENFLQMVYEWAMIDAVVAGHIDLPGFLVDDMKRRAWLGATWVGDAPGAINEKDAAQAAVVRVEGGFTTISEETAAMTGRDWDSEVQPQREAEKTRLEKAGMMYPGSNPVQEQPGVGGEGEGPESNEQEDAA